MFSTEHTVCVCVCVCGGGGGGGGMVFCTCIIFHRMVFGNHLID